MPFTGARLFYELAVAVGVQDPVAGAEFLFRTAPPIATRVLLLLLASGLLAYLGWAAKREGHLARALLVGLATIEVLAVNLDLTPVMVGGDASVRRPGLRQWVLLPTERFYVGGKFDGGLDLRDPDMAQADWAVPAGLSILDARVLFSANLAMSPNAWHIRELISVRPAAAVAHQLQPGREVVSECRQGEAGTLSAARWRQVLPARRASAAGRGPSGTSSRGLPQLMLYDCVPDARRAYVVPGSDRGPAGADSNSPRCSRTSSASTPA